jgi:nucleotide-binding universal stress UspA family protein
VPVSLLLLYESEERSIGSITTVAGMFPESRVTLLALFNSVSHDAHYHHDALEQAAQHLATEGTAVAAAAGLHATALTANTLGTTGGVAAIIGIADRLRVDLIVVRASGRGPLRTLLRGDTTTSLLHRTNRPLLVIP